MKKSVIVVLVLMLSSFVFAECGNSICDVDETVEGCPADCLKETASDLTTPIDQTSTTSDEPSDVVLSGDEAASVSNESFLSSLLFKLIVLGGVVFLAILIALIIYFVKKRAAAPAASVAQPAPVVPAAA